MHMRKHTKTQMQRLQRLLSFSDRYDISIQFWVDQTAVYIEKGGVELESYGGDFDFAIDSAIKYLERINKIYAKEGGNQ